MSLLRSVFNSTKNVANRAIHGCQQGLITQTVGVRYAGVRNYAQVSALSPCPLQKSMTSTLLGCSNSFSQRRFVQTKSDTEMSDFLRDEIQAEKESLKVTGKAVQVKGFEVETNDSEVIFKKKFENESIKVTCNVNHAVDAEQESDVEQKEDAPPMTNMVCKPNFHVEVVKNGVTLAFNCAMSHEDESEGENEQGSGEEDRDYRDQFNIEEFSIYKGEFKDSVYVISGEIMDGNFYDNLMNMLDERGINSDFVQQVTDFCTLYEQKLYINLLEHLQDIVKSK